jgi:hypothetical protein
VKNTVNSTQKILNYWRQCLVDGLFGQGVFKESDLDDLTKIDSLSIENGQVDNELLGVLFESEKEDVDAIEVLLFPKVCYQTALHNQRSQYYPQVILPIISSAFLTREGHLYPYRTQIARDVLEPQDNDSFTIGSIVDVDEFLSKKGISVIHYDREEEFDNELFEEKWRDYLADINKALNSICDDFPNHSQHYQARDYGYLIKQKDNTGMIRNILNILDHLRKNNPQAKLFENFAGAEEKKSIPLLKDENVNNYFGHSNSDYGLAKAQRRALIHLFEGDEGDILAVNGPPGTGKTTLLLSVVASLWVKAAYTKQEYPPIIVAASTNNQAVTNIIEAFEKDFARGNGVFSGRWLPDVISFGSYFPSKSKLEEANKKYHTNSFFNDLETDEYLQKALKSYSEKGQLAFPSEKALSIKSIVNKLHQAIVANVTKVEQIFNAYKNWNNAKSKLVEAIAASTHLTATQGAAVDWRTVSNEWEGYRAKCSVWLAIFSFIPAVRKKQLRLANIFLKSLLPEISKSYFVGTKITEIDSDIQEIKQVYIKAQDSHQLLKPFLDELAIKDDPTLDEIEQQTDKIIRYKLFQLTTHYWEGVWLMNMQENLSAILANKHKTKPGKGTATPRWGRRMMLTPCSVATFHMLPSLFAVSKYNKENDDFSTDYLYNAIDLLIVDESGQVTPEVAAGSFALAKKALVIGDTSQLAPIHSISSSIDFGNMKAEGVINTTEEFNAISAIGISSSSGSVMEIAQNASKYHEIPELDKGLYLLEHRRCYDDIIEYCNQLCYRGYLQAMRGEKDSTDQTSLPAMMTVHIEGACKTPSSGSKVNELEAEAVANWIAQNESRLLSEYNDALKKSDKAVHIGNIIAVITPFSPQKSAILKALKAIEVGISSNNQLITVGTVHALQGAERPIIIFSQTYSKALDGGFIDKEPSMLNVAVSRAKDTFIFFGDIDVLNRADKGSPRGILSSWVNRGIVH